MEKPIEKCPECGSKNIIVDPKHAELYCADCGVVLAEALIDRGPEWRAYDWEQAAQRIRTGPPLSYRIHDKGLSTAVPKELPQVGRLRGRIGMDSSDKTLALALGELERMASALKLPKDIREATSVLYRRAKRENLIKGRSLEELVSAMLYITCREYGVPRTLKEIANVSKMPLKKIRRAYLFLVKELEIKVAPARPARFIPRFCSTLGLSDTVRERAIEILRKSRGLGLAKGWSPTGVAAAAIYLAALQSNEPVEKKEVAKVAGTTPITLQSRYKDLKKRLRIKTDSLLLVPEHGGKACSAV
ncbi:MAG: transcription initiation factor IIB [Methanomicrobia archaeon]|nr:transcription initiation factor IIB [Methanomicrobia archaeon]